MAVPNTNTFTMKDVCNELSVNYPGTSLNELFALANDSGFDPLYKGNKNSLYNFRNYQDIQFLHHTGNKLLIHTNARGLYISPDGLYISYISSKESTGSRVTTYVLSTPYDLTSFDTSETPHITGQYTGENLTFSDDGLNMYFIDSRIDWYTLNIPFRPWYGVTYRGQYNVINNLDTGTNTTFSDPSGRVMRIYNSGKNYMLLTSLNRADLSKGLFKMGMSTPYDITTSYKISAVSSANSNSPNSDSFSIDGRFYYNFDYIFTSIKQIISDTPFSTDPNGFSIQSENIQNMPPLTPSYLMTVRSLDGRYLYVSGISEDDGERYIWEIKMPGVNTLT